MFDSSVIFTDHHRRISFLSFFKLNQTARQATLHFICMLDCERREKKQTKLHQDLFHPDRLQFVLWGLCSDSHEDIVFISTELCQTNWIDFINCQPVCIWEEKIVEWEGNYQPGPGWTTTRVWRGRFSHILISRLGWDWRRGEGRRELSCELWLAID